MKIFLATNNNNKKIEIEYIFGSISNEFEIVDDYFTDIEETSDTLEGNALLKAEHGYKPVSYTHLTLPTIYSV